MGNRQWAMGKMKRGTYHRGHRGAQRRGDWGKKEKMKSEGGKVDVEKAGSPHPALSPPPNGERVEEKS